MTDPSAGRTQPRPPDPDPAELLAGLTSEQAQAVQHGAGPLLILAGPGTGKTRTLTHRVAYLLASDRALAREILAVTFSVRAAGELRLRLAELLGERTGRGVFAATFHSVCARLLREHAERYGRTDSYTIYDQSDLRRVIEALLVDHRQREIQEAIARCGQPPAAELEAVLALAKSRLLTPESYAARSRNPAAPLVAAVWQGVDAELERCNAWSYDDLLVYAVRLLREHPARLAHLRGRWRWLLVDEMQDTNQAQAALVQLLAGADGNVAVVGDDDQCLVAGTPVTMADGTLKPIEKIRVGDAVRSSWGSGRYGPARVTRTRRRRVRRGVAIELAGGRLIVSTPEHTHFAGFLASEVRGMHLIYLMYKRGRGFRVGTAAGSYKLGPGECLGPFHRCRLEQADAVWIISAHRDERDARVAEAALACRYGLPMLTFKANHHNPRGLSQRHIDSLFAAVETETAARRLLADEGLSFDAPHHLAQTHTGRHGIVDVRRRTVTVTLCSGALGRAPVHQLSTRGCDEEGRRVLEGMGLHPKRHNRGHGGWSLERNYADYGAAIAMAHTLAALLSATVRLTARLGGAGSNRVIGRALPLLAASAVRPGMVMFTPDGYDRVDRVERVQLEKAVYDLDVAHTHNFIAGGILTHNCVYGFRSAEPRSILAFGEHYPTYRRIVLTRNFRSRAEIVDTAAASIAHNEQRHAKHLVAARGPGGRITTRGFALDRDEAAWAAGLIADALAADTPPTEILVLARTGFATAPVQAALAAAGIPHRVLGSLGLYERAEVRDALAHLALLANPADAQAYRRAVQAPRRGIGTATIAHVITDARERHGGDLITASAHAHELTAIRSAQIRLRLADFGAGLEAVRAHYRAGRSLGHVVVAAVTLDGGLVAHHHARRDRSPRPDERRDGERVLEDLRSLCRAAQAYTDQVGSGASLTGFLEHAAGLHAQELAAGEERRITVSTIHRAKGTEARLVLLLGCEERLLPSWRALESADPDALEEERRLFYVALTRAKDHLVLTRCHVRGGRPTGGPSRFLAEAGLATGARSLAA